MTKIKDADRFMSLWMDFHSAAYSIPENNPALIEADPRQLVAAEKLINKAKLLFDEFGDELMAAARTVQDAICQDSNEQNLSISSYHGYRMKSLKAQYEALNGEIQEMQESTASEVGDMRYSLLSKIAELEGRKKKIGYDLDKHTTKLSNRGHDFRFNKMRKRR